MVHSSTISPMHVVLVASKTIRIFIVVLVAFESSFPHRTNRSEEQDFKKGHSQRESALNSVFLPQKITFSEGIILREDFMTSLTFKAEISIGNILTTVTILVSMITLVRSWRKDIQLKRKKYADRIRRAAGLIIAKLERWRELSLSFFADIQPLITDADVKLTETQDLIAVRDSFWRDVIATRSKVLRDILSEQIEITYSDLYGYDPRVQELFTEAINRIKSIDEDIYSQVMMVTQDDIFNLEDKSPYHSAQLGNLLRETIGNLANKQRHLIEDIISLYRQQMIKLIMASDEEIVAKRVQISSLESAHKNPK